MIIAAQKKERIKRDFFYFSSPGGARAHTRNHSSALLLGSSDGEPPTSDARGQCRYG